MWGLLENQWCRGDPVREGGSLEGVRERWRGAGEEMKWNIVHIDGSKWVWYITWSFFLRTTKVGLRTRLDTLETLLLLQTKRPKWYQLRRFYTQTRLMGPRLALSLNNYSYRSLPFPLTRPLRTTLPKSTALLLLQNTLALLRAAMLPWIHRI